MKKHKFPCGCEVEILDEAIKGYDGLPTLNIDYNNIPLDCPDTWDMICDGNTKGVFQLESGLGIAWSKKAKPRNIEELSDLVSILRPGTLDAITDGKSMTQHYCDRKHGKEESVSLHPELDEILSPTQNILLFQEQILSVAKKIAGFTLQQADMLRKAVGKKDSALMAKTKVEFLDGCKKVGLVDDLDAEIIFENIQSSSRYSFNKCLSPETIVELDNKSFKPLSEIEIGDKILCPNYKQNIDEYYEVVDKHDNGQQELYEIELDSGKKIQCTLNHKFLTGENNIKELWEIIQDGDSIVCEDD